MHFNSENAWHHITHSLLIVADKASNKVSHVEVRSASAVDYTAVAPADIKTRKHNRDCERQLCNIATASASRRSAHSSHSLSVQQSLSAMWTPESMLVA